MRKTAIIARREYQALVRTKAFIISLLVMPIFMFGGIFIQKFLAGRVDVSEKKVVILDATGRLFEPLEGLAKLRNETELVDKETGRKTRPTITLEQGAAGKVTDEMRIALSDRVRHNEIFAFVEIDANALSRSADSPLTKLLSSAIPAAEKPHENGDGNSKPVPAKVESQNDKPPGAAVRVHMESIAYNKGGWWLNQALNQVSFALRLQDAGLNPGVVAGAISPMSIEESGLYSHKASGEIQENQAAARGINFFLPLGLMMLMFMSVMIVGQPMIGSVLEEKQQRIAEVLLGSASPFQLMMGKLLGNVGVALTVVGIYLTGGYLVAAYYGYAELLPMWLLGWLIAFEVLACVLYGAIFVAIGSACTEIKDAQTLLTPVMILLVLPLMVWFTVVQEPLSSFAFWVSMLPPATPMLMLLRMAASPVVPWWQPMLGIILVLATTLFCVFAAGRVFRIGLLSQGKTPRMHELIRWIVHG